MHFEAKDLHLIIRIIKSSRSPDILADANNYLGSGMLTKLSRTCSKVKSGVLG